MSHIEIHLNWDELPPDGTVFGVGYVVPDGGDDPQPDDPQPMESAEPASARSIAMAEAMGGDAGEAAAASWLRATVLGASDRERLPRLQRVLQALEDDDHDTLDAYNLPRPDLSGEWADTLTGPRLVDACTEGMAGDDAQDRFPDICNAYEQAFTLSVQAHLRPMIAEQFGDKNPEWLLSENYPMTEADIEALFDLIPGARDALQGMDIDNTRDVWDNIAINMQGMLDEFTRDDLRKRTATALRVMVYGEWVDEAYPS